MILFGIVKVFREMKSGRHDERALEELLGSRGLMNRFLGRLTKTVTKPSQMYPIGVLFGLGFDTATEVALLVLAGGAAGAGLPWYAILCLPRHPRARAARPRWRCRIPDRRGRRFGTSGGAC
ncbi:MAG: hypothetical protein ACLQMH_02890 [Solirubrobacteraceae bacterium]